MTEPEPALFRDNETMLESASQPTTVPIGDFLTESGKVVPNAHVAVQTFGERRGVNSVLVCHALTGDANVTGWWGRLVGPGLALDTERYHVVGTNLLGGCSGSTGPATLAGDENPFGSRFPVLTVGDQVRAMTLALDAMSVERLHAVVGASTGAFHALEFARQFPERVGRVICTAGAARQNAVHIALNEIGRQAIMRDPKWRGGDYPLDDPPSDGLAVARMIGHVGYLSGEALERKFGRRLQEREDFVYTLDVEFAVESYLRHQAAKFTERFDANTYLILTRAANYFELSDYPKAGPPCTFIAFASDTLYPPSASERAATIVRERGAEAEVVVCRCPWGHDSFLLDDGEQAAAIRRALQS
ncbi:MAG: homoserine O-acetyltransferase [Armatimonadota bacterium]